MNAYKQLREIAAKKRDDAIALARAEYKTSIKEIGKLEIRLQPRQARKPRAKPPAKIRMVDVIYDNLPTDRAFSYADVVAIIETIPTVSYKASSINVTLSRLLKAGDIKRVRYAKNGRSALFALPDVEVEIE